MPAPTAADRPDAGTGGVVPVVSGSGADPDEVPTRVVRIVPDVLGIDKEFDYEVPPELAGRVELGDIVRIDLQGRRVRGWVVAIDPPDARRTDLKPLVRWSSRGPDGSLIDLAHWAARRWVGRRRTFLALASPDRNVDHVPRSRRTGAVVEPRSPASTAMLRGVGGVLQLPPTSDPMPAIASAVALGPTLVIVPAVDEALLLAARLRRSGLSVASVPDEWASAAGSVDVVVGARSAAWAPCPGLAAAVVIDEHDEALQDEGSPTWHARDVVVERCARSGAPVLLVSPCPTLTALAWRPATRPPREREWRGWPEVVVVDRTSDEPWKRSLVTSELIEELRDHGRRVVCISNTTGRARLLACRSCRELTRCERCDAAVEQRDDGALWCRRCGTERPPVCLVCGAGRFANLRPGVQRLGEEIAAAANRPVDVITGSAGVAPTHDVVVGTEAALHRTDAVDVVAFLEFDRELLAPRYRAAEQAMALLVRAARLVGPRDRGGRVLVQTFLPEHEVVRAAVAADPARIVRGERDRRSMLGLPPYGAYAEISGAGSDEFVASLPPSDDVVVAGSDDAYVARAGGWEQLSSVLAAGRRPTGSRLRIAVDPPR